MSSSRPAISKTALDALIEEATVDCYDEEEQVTGLFTRHIAAGGLNLSRPLSSAAAALQ